MINELIRLATHLDNCGLTKEASYLDAVIRKLATFEEGEQEFTDIINQLNDAGSAERSYGRDQDDAMLLDARKIQELKDRAAEIVRQIYTKEEIEAEIEGLTRSIEESSEEISSRRMEPPEGAEKIPNSTRGPRASALSRAGKRKPTSAFVNEVENLSTTREIFMQALEELEEDGDSDGDAFSEMTLPEESSWQAESRWDEFAP